MSRTGVIQSCMVELQANVAHILNHPAKKQVVTSTGTEDVWAQIILAAIKAMQHIDNATRLEYRNFSRNMTAKFIDIPISWAYPAMRISSCIRAVVPTMSEAAARYRPPENWIIRTNNMNNHGFKRRGM